MRHGRRGARTGKDAARCPVVRAARNAQLFDSFVLFSRAHVESKDIDPMYPLLSSVFNSRGFDEEQRAWFLLLYLTWYHVGSAERVFSSFSRPQELPPLKMPTGTERRAFRGNTGGSAFVNAVLSTGSVVDWSTPSVEGAGGWSEIRERVQAVRFGGPWSSYKWADLCKNVLRRNITAADIGVGGGGETAGPVPGMVALTGRHWKECATNVALQRDLLGEALERGVPFSGLDQLETSLCDFNSLLKGRYYVGHDIDDNMKKIDGCGALWWESRARVFDARRLGEAGGWFGVRKKLCRAFIDNGTVIL